jgi:hypothetical protein
MWTDDFELLDCRGLGADSGFLSLGAGPWSIQQPIGNLSVLV